MVIYCQPWWLRTTSLWRCSLLIFVTCIPLLNAVTVGFQRRFSNCLNLTPDVNIAMLATMTHPFFKLCWLPPNLADQQNRWRSLLITAAKDISASVFSPSEQQKSDDKDDDCFGFSRQSSVNDDVETTTFSTNKQELEVMQFLEEKRKDVAVLHSYPIVKKLFLKYNALIPSSAPVERLFSFAGMIVRPHRRCMSDKIFEQLLLLKDN